MDEEKKALISVVKKLCLVFIEGRCYQTQNPYTRPEVKEAMKLLARLEGTDEKQWISVNLREKL